MGLLPIGFFSPLPLAMMIPFMATQSLAMGEAFGKSFQYGKRKISSMSNEEFNKYTTQDMMNEQTANVKLMIPSLHQQMQDSYTLQQDIFEEMIRIIPAFFEALMKVWNASGLAEEFRTFDKTPFNQIIPRPDSGGTLVSAHGAPDITNISHEDYIPEITITQPVHDWRHSLSEINSLPLNELESLLKYNNYNKPDERTAIVKRAQMLRAQILNKPTGNLAPALNKTLGEAQAFTAWQSQLTHDINQFLKAKALYITYTTGTGSTANAKIKLEEMRMWASKIKTISNDYRNPNNGIRTAVLQLRQEIVNGLLKIPY